MQIGFGKFDRNLFAETESNESMGDGRAVLAFRVCNSLKKYCHPERSEGPAFQQFTPPVHTPKNAANFRLGTLASTRPSGWNRIGLNRGAGRPAIRPSRQVPPQEESTRLYWSRFRSASAWQDCSANLLLPRRPVYSALSICARCSLSLESI